MSKVAKKHYTINTDDVKEIMSLLPKLNSVQLGNLLHEMFTIEKKKIYLALKPFLKEEFQSPNKLAKQSGFPYSHETLYSWERTSKGGDLS